MNIFQTKLKKNFNRPYAAKYYHTIKAGLMAGLFFFIGCNARLPECAVSKVHKINYVDKLDYDGPAFAYTEKYDIYIKKFNNFDKFLLLLSGTDEAGVLRHEIAHIYDLWMFYNKFELWKKFNEEHYNNTILWDYNRRERFAEEVRTGKYQAYLREGCK